MFYFDHVLGIINPLNKLVLVDRQENQNLRQADFNHSSSSNAKSITSYNSYNNNNIIDNSFKVTLRPKT